ncbi:MAG: N-acyl homoserine lactonase family protein [Clostridiales bacterium]|nr:N-acyl homoserine lactonase family protein [Clostridiales bacterium]
MKLFCIQVGAFRMPRGFVAARCNNAGDIALMPIFAYLIEHPKGLILVDTGQSYAMRDENSVIEERDTILFKLGELGYNPDDVRYVVMSHMHLDHAGYMNDFPNSVFIVRKEELKAAWWPESCEGGYVFPTFEKTRGYEFIQPADDEDYDIFMDGSVVLIDTRGHSRGHQSVIVALQRSGKLVLASDAAPLKEVLERKLLPGTCTDNWQAVRSVEKLVHLEECGYKIIFPHDPDNLPEKVFPEYYD